MGIIFSNITKISIGVLAIICLYLFTSRGYIQRDLEIAESNLITLQTSLSQQSNTIEFLEKSQLSMNNSVQELLTKNSDINNRLSISLEKVNELRSKEKQRVFQEPYQRGNVATDMLNERMSAIITQTNRSDNSVN